MKKKIVEVILQIIPVMIGVYLGFVVSNWSETNKTKSRTQLLQKNIAAEIQSNKTKITDVVEYHTMVRDSSNYYRNMADIGKMPSFFKGTRTVTLINSAFDTGIQTGLINNLEFEEIQSINNVYTLQSAYKDFTNLMVSGLLTSDFEDNNEGIKKFCSFLAVTMYDIVSQENELIENYDQLLKKIKTE